MFTGIVEATVPVRSLESRGNGARLVIPAPGLEGWNPRLGDSIAICGACLTVAELLPGGDHALPDLAFDLSAETLECTWLGDLEPGTLVNVERALLFSARLDGHLVSGHVDGIGRVVAVQDPGDGGAEIEFEVPSELARYLVDKGSVTLDGTSLTVVRPEQGRFSVAVIPLTLELTRLGRAQPGDRVNVEVDLVGKWVERLMRNGLVPGS